MALFKKNNLNEYEKAASELNNSSKHQQSSDKIIFEKLADDDDKATALVESMKEGKPLVVNFADLDLMAANKMLAFLSGACYAIEGNIVKINEATYLFARKVDFMDGSLQLFLEEL